MGVGTRHCRVLTVSNINSDATGVDINRKSKIENLKSIVRTSGLFTKNAIGLLFDD
jgi:hypothetical protein